MKKEIKFTPHERRVLGMPQSEKQMGPEAVAIRRILDNFPLIIRAIECDYDPLVNMAFIQATASLIVMDKEIKSYQELRQKK